MFCSILRCETYLWEVVKEIPYNFNTYEKSNSSLYFSVPNPYLQAVQGSTGTLHGKVEQQGVWMHGLARGLTLD